MLAFLAFALSPAEASVVAPAPPHCVAGTCAGLTAADVLRLAGRLEAEK
jgi:hypothetical protein